MDIAEHQWRDKYRAALVERDAGHLSQLIRDARQAIQDRIQEISGESSERQELDSALKVLEVLSGQIHRRATPHKSSN